MAYIRQFNGHRLVKTCVRIDALKRLPFEKQKINNFHIPTLRDWQRQTKKTHVNMFTSAASHT